MEVLKGFVEHIIYRNEENGYTVLNLTSGTEEITCVGSLPYISEGETIEASGFYSSHPSYGDQFRIDHYEVKPPEDEISVERYLSSGAIKGIGSALAARIVRRFHADTFRIIEEEPERLAEIKGISERKAREIASQVEEKKEVREAMIYLAKFGISNNLAVKIYDRYGSEIYHVIQENPYRMADDITGVGFKIADEIARRAGIRADADFRIRSGIFYVLQQAGSEGHIFLPDDILRARTAGLLEIPIEDLDGYLRDLAIEKKIVVKRPPVSEEDPGESIPDPSVLYPDMMQTEKRQWVYASSLYYMELNTARMLHDLNVEAHIDEAPVRAKIQRIEKLTHTELDDMQKQAILEAVRRGLLILTGGPGTGKTTTINTMIRYFEEEGFKIALTAPTGRAAKRMTEATGCEAKTIHRLLEVEGGMDAGPVSFSRNGSNPLEYDVIIVDEMSMVDIYLMHALLSAVTIGTRLILVGDANQLPSVGPGCILRDMIESGRCHVVCLTRIFRQAEQSDIVVNAHRIHQGQHMLLDNKSKDFFFLKREDVNVIISIVIQLVRDKLPGYVHASSREIQVLTPTRKGLLGVERLNRILQEYLNPPDRGKSEYAHGEGLFREGDKVMQIRNNYQMEWKVPGKYGFSVDYGTGVFNGDIGVITQISEEAQTLSVEFDDHRTAEYPFSSLEELELAYAVTVHKAQGSEYPAVVIPLLEGPRMLMNRNLLYTAVTRARSCVTMVGDPSVFYRMIDNTTEQKRYSSLALRLKELNEI